MKKTIPKGSYARSKTYSPRDILRASRSLGIDGWLHVGRGVLPIRGLAKSKWHTGIFAEVVFWDKFFSTKGLFWPDDYARRLNPDLPLQDDVRDLLRTGSDVHILDVGAGPLTVLGKKCRGIHVDITAVDALAFVYDRILQRYGVEPLVRTQRVEAEELAGRFAMDTFDLVYARNSIDHTYDPERAILEMISVVKPGCYVLLEHAINEGENWGYRGLHQWNFSAKDEAFIIRGRNSVVNITEKYSNLCTIACEIGETENPARGGKVPWLVAKIRKKLSQR